MNEIKKNIIISCGSQSWGGLEMIALETARQLSEFNNVIVVCYKNSILESNSRMLNLKTEPIFSKDSLLPASVKKMKSLLLENKTEIIHTHLSHDLWTLVPALISSKSKAKLFLTKHMASGVRKKDILHKYLYRRVDGIFAVSNYIKESVINTCPVPVEKIHLIYDGIDTDKFKKELYNGIASRKSLNIGEDKLVIGIIGRITPGKGHEEFLEAAKIILAQEIKNIFFLVVGGASSSEKNYETKIKRLSVKFGLTNNILFTGFRNDIPEMLSAMDILAFPSHNESFGITLLEAMAIELPVAASNNAGIPDIVVDGVTGLLVPPKNSSELSKALLKLIENPSLRKKLSEAAKKRVIENFDIKIIVTKLLNFYNS